MDITYYGQSCFKINSKKGSFLFDPFISPNELAKDIAVDSIECDYMLISHGHEDHIADAEQIAKNCNPTIVSNFEIVSWFGAKGFKKLHPMNLGGAWNFDFGRLKMVNAVHSSILPDGTYAGNPGGFILEIDQKKVYYAGDTALHSDMKLIGEFEKPDLAFLPIGDNFTMGIEDAIRAAKMIHCKEIIGMHYDTFPYIEINKKDAITQFAEAGLNLTLIAIGDSINF